MFIDVYSPATQWIFDILDTIAEARPKLISFLDTMRHMLEEISPKVGVTDAVSGPVVVEH